MTSTIPEQDTAEMRDSIAEIEERAGLPSGSDVVRLATHIGERLMQPLCEANWTLDAITDLASTLAVESYAFNSSRTDIPALIAMVKSLQAENLKMREALEEAADTLAMAFGDDAREVIEARASIAKDKGEKDAAG